MENKSQQISEYIKELEAAKLIVDEKLIQSEKKNQELGQILEQQERTLSVNR